MSEQQGVINSSQRLNIEQACEQLGVSPATIRRYIKAGKVDAELVKGRFGKEYRITIPQELMDIIKPPVNQAFGYSQLIARIEELNQEVGYWKGKAEELDKRVLLLTTPKRSFWDRLFHL